jgi:cadmium-exporting ATPase
MCEHHHEEETKLWQPILSGVLLAAGIAFTWMGCGWFSRPWVQLAWYIAAYLPVGFGVMHEAVEEAMKGDVFSEFMLMSVACVGAFAIGEYPEAVAVMWLYCIGEALQDRAVHKARNSISSLTNYRPEQARLVRWNGEKNAMEQVLVKPEMVSVGDVIEVLPGERVPLDGVLLLPDGERDALVNFDTAALTGESMPRQVGMEGEVLAGMIALERAASLRVTRPQSESALTRILKMVEEATERKAPTELFIRRFARIYTPIVILLAVLTVVLPWAYTLFAPSFHYHFATWLHRALVFLVISCPCALVISVPLSYFAGIGRASRMGVLFKGGNSLDALTGVDTVVFDKTGTLTTGAFGVRQTMQLSPEELQTVVAMERSSTHPIAKAIVKVYGEGEKINAENMPGLGLRAEIAGETWLAGTLRLLENQGVSYPEELQTIPDTIVACAKNGRFIGCILLSDTLKPDAADAISMLRKVGITLVEMLSGDKQALVDKVADELKLEQALGDLLPQHKAERIETLQKQGRKVAFVGDGINDAPVLALSDVGIAMGGAGADMAIETADVVLQTDQPSRLAQALGLARKTRAIVWQNIAFAIGVKVVVMVLGLMGIATLWEAVFADSGVALLAVVNAMRIMRGK